MIANIQISKKVFNDAYLPYLEDESRYLVFYGGGSSGKSFFVAQRYIYKLLKNKRCNLLCVRQTGDTNRKSTFPLLKQVLRQWGLTKHFKVNEADMRIRCLLNGNEVAFVGLDDVEKVKSITFANGELTDIWVEEATECTEAAVNQLKVRLRGGNTKKQMVLTFNPVNINHWIKAHFIDSGLATVCFSTYKDNKFLTEDDRKALEELRFSDEYTYRVYCLGEWGVLGKTVFDARAIQTRLEHLPRVLKQGFFEYDYDGINISNIRWVNDPNGFIKLYALPTLTQYCIGGDTAGGDSGDDFFTAHVLDAKTGEQVAVLKHRFDSDLYAKQVYCLGRYYKDALVGIEANFDSFPILELQRVGYTNQYVREAIDSYTGRTEKKFGFKTTSLTRQPIISRLIEIVREHCETINDKATLEELLTIIRNEMGRIEAPVGGHDDMMMGLAIAHQIREQVDFTEEVVEMPERHFFDDDNEWDASQDWGQPISIV